MESDQTLHRHWYWQDLGWGCWTSGFHEFLMGALTLDWCRDFISAQYLGNKLMEFDQILHMHWYWQHLGWYCYTSIFTNLQQSYGPCLLSEICIRSISWEQIGGLLTNLHMHWYWQVPHQISQINNRSYGSWSISEFHFRSVSWEQIYGIWPNFAYVFILTASRLGLLDVSFHEFLTRVMTLDWCQNFVSAQYLENKLMEVLHLYWQHLDWYCYMLISLMHNRVMALD